MREAPLTLSHAIHAIRQRLAKHILPAGSSVAGAQLSMIGFDDLGRPSDRLLDIALEAAKLARSENLDALSARTPTLPRWPSIWPGEHYRLLAALVRHLKPQVVVEIGTYRGTSALALLENLPAGGKVHTFDVVPYDRIEPRSLAPQDFSDGRLVQIVDDVTSAAGFERRKSLIESADLIFVDAAKDGRMEQRLLDSFERCQFNRDPLIVFDDIRVWNMLRIWSNIRRPKLDLTSFGHYSGTGLIDWNGRSREPEPGGPR
jgi:predicted O-methyltransferase YrrM